MMQRFTHSLATQEVASATKVIATSIHSLPLELMDHIFLFIALQTADSRSAINPILSVSNGFHRARRISYFSLCLLRSEREQAIEMASESMRQDALSVRRLLLSFKDLSSTPSDQTIPNLFRATKNLRNLIFYLCETEVCDNMVVALSELVHLVEVSSQIIFKCFEND